MLSRSASMILHSSLVFVLTFSMSFASEPARAQGMAPAPTSTTAPFEVTAPVVAPPVDNETAKRLASGDQPERLNFLDIFKRIPQSLGVTADYSFSKGAIPAYVGILASTAFLYHYDEDILVGFKRQGRNWGMVNTDNTKSVFNIGDLEILRLPTDAASLLYSLGDGWTHTFIAGGFLASGYLRDNNRAINTGYEVIQGMMLSTVASQVFKRATGRQSPNQKSEERGAWRPFPSVAAYQARTAEYDAMPSGHIMTATMTFTVIRENYPEYDHVLLPLEVVYLAALGFGMVNNGVHWASDYPLGIGLGYVFGKGAASITKKNKEALDDTKPHSTYFPTVSPDGDVLANWSYQF